MSNAKRAIMVPVMTLAVCAIAMVGLGFAISTSVTSNSNTVEKLMIDLDSDNSKLTSQNVPDDDDVNSLFDYRITSEKSSNTDNKTVTIKYKLDSKNSYLKVFSNVEQKTATLKVSGTGLSANITEVVLGLYEVSGGQPIATVTVTNGSDNAFISPSNSGSSNSGSSNAFTVNANKVYMVKIDKVTIDGIQYVSGDNGITISKKINGENTTYSIEGSKTTNVTGFPSFNGTYSSLGFTFTAEADPAE